MSTSTIEQLAENESTRKAELLTERREILTRGDNPEPGDVERLGEINAALGISLEQTRRDAAIFHQVDELQRGATIPAELADQVAAASQAVHDFDAETDRIAHEREEQRVELSISYDRLVTTKRRAEDAGGRLRLLQRQHAELLGLPAVKEVLSTRPRLPSTPAGFDWRDVPQAPAALQKPIPQMDAERGGPFRSAAIQARFGTEPQAGEVGVGAAAVGADQAGEE